MRPMRAYSAYGLNSNKSCRGLTNVTARVSRVQDVSEVFIEGLQMFDRALYRTGRDRGFGAGLRSFLIDF